MPPVNAEVEKSVRQEFLDETASIVRGRLPRAVAVFLAVFALAASFELVAHPERALLYATTYAAEAAVCLAALGFAKSAPCRAVAIVSGASALLVCLVALYHVVARGEFEIMILASGFVQVGTAVWFPWGLRGQLPVVGAAFLTGLAASTSPVHRASPGLDLLGLFTIGGLTLVSARAIEQDRLTFFRRTVELRRTNARLDLTNRTHTQFLANVSHELRTPLDAMLGYLDMLSEGTFGALPSGARGCLDRIQANARLLLRLAGDFLDLSRLDADRIGLQMSDVEVSPLCAELAETARMQLQGKPVELVLEVPPELAVRADPDRLRQVLGNLLSNASKFTERGTITIRATRGSDTTVRIDVTDTGVGISPDEREAIFEPFHRGRHAGRVGGVGIGLALSRRLVEAMNGHITVEGAPGKGSTFSVQLRCGMAARS